MGGSSMAGEILSMVRDDVVIHWDYDLPQTAQKGDVVVCTSWSGNTEEILSSWHAARIHGLDTLAITTGGELARLASEASTPLIRFEGMEVVPRLHAAHMTGALFAALGIADQLPVSEALDSRGAQEQGAAIARAIGNRVLALTAAYPWRKLTGFWKMIYSETVKRQVMVNWFPSGAHTEVVGWEGPYGNDIAHVLLRDPGQEDERYTKNFDALLAILEKRGYTVSTVSLSGNTVLEQVFNNYLLALWTSLHAADNLGIDPVAVALLDEFKALKAAG
jgi:glucose/mannose-6-phosphate isomerase